MGLRQVGLNFLGVRRKIEISELVFLSQLNKCEMLGLNIQNDVIFKYPPFYQDKSTKDLSKLKN